MGLEILGIRNEERTKPREKFPNGYRANPADLAAGRYGTYETIQTWGAEKTFEISLKVQGQSALTLSRISPDVVLDNHAIEIAEKANLRYVKADRIRELEEISGHDVIAINTALEEVVSPLAGADINKAKTSADTTVNARALQLKNSLEIIAESGENLRDILIEKSVQWIDVPFMVCTHGYDALPSVAGRAFIHYAEMLQSGLNVLKFFYNNSIIGKWADATGDHHSAKCLGINGMNLQREFCKDLGIGYTDAPAQVPGLEFELDGVYAGARISATINNIAKFIAWGRSDDVDVFVNASPKKKKGSSAMPHKDAKNGNPDIEEQATSYNNYAAGSLITAFLNCEMPYARALYASANSRINSEYGFKFFDHVIRRMANITYWLNINEERSKERVLRSYGVVTSQQVMTYLTDHRRTQNPMTRSQAHDLMGKLAAYAWNKKILFQEVVLGDKNIRERLDEDTIKKITDPLSYIGESREIIKEEALKYHKKKTL